MRYIVIRLSRQDAQRLIAQNRAMIAWLRLQNLWLRFRLWLMRA